MDFAELAFNKIEGLSLRNDSFYVPENIHTSDKFGITKALQEWNGKDKVVFLFSVSLSEQEQVSNTLIRKELYALENIKRPFLFFDLGDLKISKEKAESALTYIFSEVHENFEADYKFVVLAPSRKLIPPIATAIPEKDIIVSDVNIRFDLEKETKQLNNSGKILFYNLLPVLQFYYNKEVHGNSDYVNIIRLGEIKNDTFLAEPYFRESRLAVYSADAVSAVFAPGSDMKSPNGLDAYQFSTFSYLAAICHSIRYNVYTAYNHPSDDPANLTGKLLAQSLWLYLNTFTTAEEEDPKIMSETDDFEKFIHYYTDFDSELIFYKSKKTGRMWFYVPGQDFFVAISEKEYLNITKGLVPDRIFKILKKL